MAGEKQENAMDTGLRESERRCFDNGDVCLI
jgi:hypothetical protein